MKETREVTIYRCDEPTCPVEAVMQAEELPDGFHGTVLLADVILITGDGDWYACRRTHIQGAVLAAIDAVIERSRS